MLKPLIPDPRREAQHNAEVTNHNPDLKRETQHNAEVTSHNSDPRREKHHIEKHIFSVTYFYHTKG